jgi:hypothetical protein
MGCSASGITKGSASNTSDAPRESDRSEFETDGKLDYGSAWHVSRDGGRATERVNCAAGCDVVGERDGDHLRLSMGEQWRFPLRCYDPDQLLFFYETTGENEVGISGVHVERGGASACW